MYLDSACVGVSCRGASVFFSFSSGSSLLLAGRQTGASSVHYTLDTHTYAE